MHEDVLDTMDSTVSPHPPVPGQRVSTSSLEVHSGPGEENPGPSGQGQVENEPAQGEHVRRNRRRARREREADLMRHIEGRKMYFWRLIFFR